jgi:catechol 2,3-dioxygenase-like lactoylglutathione lyase family enzyme
MLLNAGIITTKLSESKTFYTQTLGFKVKFEADWFVLLHTATHADHEMAFMLPQLASQQPVFHPEFNGKGVYITLEVDNVMHEYNRIKSTGISIEVELRDEPWGDRHFAVVDPNGIPVDIVERFTNSQT